MQCPSCGFENTEGMNFCGQCATSLSPRCPQCGFENPPGFAFCGKCATSLIKKEGERAKPCPELVEGAKGESTDSPSPLPFPLSPSTEAERRQLTVMFCDLVGSTALSEQLDPEELREVVKAYQQSCEKVILHFEGHVAQYLGDGLLVYFGYPVAHEDDAQRAVRTGLGIVEEMKRVNAGLADRGSKIEDRGSRSSIFDPRSSIQLSVRIGIHTGLVVVGEMGGSSKREQLALGDTPNIAARVQGLAEPDTVVISQAIYRLVQGYFACQDLGVHSLKGITQPMGVYRVVQESETQSRLEVAARVGLTPLIGRELEVRMLLERWEQVKGGSGQVVLLSGEAGIGKSRLVQVMKEQIAREGYTKIEYHCSPYYQNSAFYPIIHHLQRVFKFSKEDTPQEKLSKLERFFKERESGRVGEWENDRPISHSPTLPL